MFNLIQKLRIKFNPFIRYKSNFPDDTKYITQTKREVPIIISITSRENNFRDLELTLYSLLNQSVAPDRIILWLSNEYNLSELPYGITRFVKNGLEIRFIKDLKDYNKIIYPFKEFPDNIIVTASDFIYYKKDWLEKLYHSFISNPDEIHTHTACRLNYDNSNISCKNIINEESARFDNLAVGYGGILYPPDCFTNEVFRKDIYKSFSDNSDVWMWMMSLLSGRKTRIVKSHIKTLSCTNLIKFLKNILKKDKIYNNQIDGLVPFYSQNIKQKLKNTY